MDEDDFFSDDDLNDIPDNTLQDLEIKALQSTQASAVAAPRPALFKKQAHNASSFNRPASSSRIPPWRPPQRSQLPVLQQKQSAPPASAPEPPSSDYGFDDEDVIDLDEPSMVIQTVSGLPIRNNAERPSLPPAVVSKTRSKSALDPETEAAFAAADEELGSPPNGQWLQAPHLAPKPNGAIDVSSLQARVAELEAEQARLRKAEEDARNIALAKQGEIAIVRANQEKATREYERRLAVMQKLHADESTKQKAEIETSKKEREKTETDNRFLQHDLAQEAERVKRLKGPGKARAGASRQRDTPRAERTTHGDGFADDELVTASPSKSNDKSRKQTPKAGAKRKRQAQDSPIAPLLFSQPAQPHREESANSAVSAEPPRPVTPAVKEDSRYALLQRIHNYRPYPTHERTIEALSKHYLPSKPDKSMFALLLDDLSLLSPLGKGEPPTIETTRALLRLWSSCLMERYYAPLNLIRDIVRFILDSELPSAAAALIEQAIPICARSIELIANPRVRASNNPTFAAGLDRQAQEALAAQLQVDEVLDFLHYMAQTGTLSEERNRAFWEHLPFNHLVLILHKAHPIEQLLVALQILGTSCLPTSFATIAQDSTTQAQQERHTIDQLTNLFFEMPDVPTGEPAYTEEETAELRVEVLKVLRTMCLTEHGTQLLAEHPSAIGRLLRFVEGQVRKLYILPPSFGRIAADNRSDPTAHDLVVTSINMTVRTLYHVIQAHDSSIDFNQKFRAVHGGYHKFLVGLTRVAFTEQLVFEHGIESEVAEAAHAILDNILSPEEGEAVVKAVETPRGTGGSTTRRAESTEVDTNELAVLDGDIIITDAPG